MRDLGVTFDQFLNFDDHITAICRSTYFHIRNIGKIRNLLSYNACSAIIHALISCRLDYCNSLLYNVPTHKTDRLQRLQNQCAHILTKSPRREHITPVLKIDKRCFRGGKSALSSHKAPSCCCLPTPMALASGGSPMFPLVVHQPASPSIWPAVQSLRRGLHKSRGDNVVRMWVQLER